MKFTLTNAVASGWKGLKGWAYSSKEDFAGLSSAVFEVTENHGMVKTEVSDRLYYILDGEGEFDIDGKIEKVLKGDVVIVPKNTPYDYRTKSAYLKLFLVHSPAYDESKEKKI